MEKNKVLLVLILTAIISIILTYSFYESSKIYSVKELNMDIVIGDHIGLNTDADAIHFGTTIPGTSSNREIVLNIDKDLIVNLKILGNLSQFIKISENNFLLKKNEERSIKLTATIPLNTTKGVYTGILKITFKLN